MELTADEKSALEAITNGDYDFADPRYMQALAKQNAILASQVSRIGKTADEVSKTAADQVRERTESAEARAWAEQNAAGFKLPVDTVTTMVGDFQKALKSHPGFDDLSENTKELIASAEWAKIETATRAKAEKPAAAAPTKPQTAAAPKSPAAVAKPAAVATKPPAKAIPNTRVTTPKAASNVPASSLVKTRLRVEGPIED